MANNLNQDIEGKVVVLDVRIMKPEHRSLNNRLFKVRDGFGACAHTHGTALFGTFLSDGEECRMEGYDVERLATDEEVEALVRKQAVTG